MLAQQTTFSEADQLPEFRIVVLMTRPPGLAADPGPDYPHCMIGHQRLAANLTKIHGFRLSADDPMLTADLLNKGSSASSAGPQT